jgi:hypothetical protein
MFFVIGVRVLKTCPHAPEIKTKLLLPRCRTLLQKYIDRWKSDPGFLVYHRESTTLALRQELGCSHVSKGSRCHNVRLGECCIVDGLKEAIEERVIEQEVAPVVEAR